MIDDRARELTRHHLGEQGEADVFALAGDSDENYAELSQRAIVGGVASLQMSEREYRVSRDNDVTETRRIVTEELETAARGANAGGALRCMACGADNIVVQQKQTRSADEGMTVFCGCQECGRQWRMA